MTILVSYSIAEEYEMKTILLPYGEKESELGYLPEEPDIDYEGDTIWIGPFHPREFDIDNNRHIYVADVVKRRIAKFTAEGHFMSTVGWISRSNVDLSKDEIITTKSGRTYYLARHRVYFPPDKHYSELPLSYFGEIKDIAVNSEGYIYVTHLESSYLYKFDNQGIPVIVIDSFGSFGYNEIWKVSGLSSDPFENIKACISVKSRDLYPKGYFYVCLDGNDNVISASQSRIMKDKYGRTFRFLPRSRNEDSLHIASILIEEEKNDEKMEQILFFEFPKSKSDSIMKALGMTLPDIQLRITGTPLGIDGYGNIYYRIGPAVLKYNDAGELLARIEGIIPLKNVIKENGDIYFGCMEDDGYRIFKYLLKQETKGKILKEE